MILPPIPPDVRPMTERARLWRTSMRPFWTAQARFPIGSWPGHVFDPGVGVSPDNFTALVEDIDTAKVVSSRETLVAAKCTCTQGATATHETAK
jgi:hypothetical protein